MRLSALVLAAVLPGACLARADQARGHVQVLSEPGVQVLLDGLLVGITSADVGGLVVPDVASGVHVLKAARPGFATQEERVVVEPGKIQVVTLRPFQAQDAATASACPPCPVCPGLAPAKTAEPARAEPEPEPRVRPRAKATEPVVEEDDAPLRPGTRDVDRAIEQAARLQERGRSEAALRMYDKVVAAQPDHAEAHLGRGIALRELGRPAEAEKACRRALDLNPRFADAMMALGDALRHQGRNKPAGEWYRKYLDSLPDGDHAAEAKTHLKAMGEPLP